MNTVSLYNRRGFVKDLASLNTRRRSHGCGHYRNNNGDKVLRNMFGFSILINYDVSGISGVRWLGW